MAFTVPTFNLAVSIWRDSVSPNDYTVPDVNAIGNLTPGRRVTMTTSPSVVRPTQMEVLLPAGTDIRADWNGTNEDVVEIPAGSKRFYSVTSVDDIGKGFPNEHRIAWLFYLVNGATFIVQGAIPAPVPLP